MPWRWPLQMLVAVPSKRRKRERAEFVAEEISAGPGDDSRFLSITLLQLTSYRRMDCESLEK